MCLQRGSFGSLSSFVYTVSMETNKQTIRDIDARLRSADRAAFEVLERSFRADTRKTVQRSLEKARRRLEAEERESARVAGLYEFQSSLCTGALVGCDEVGRGPLAGPLTVGAVVLPREPHIAGLNDSKQVAPERRVEIAAQIKEASIAWAVEHIEPSQIDDLGMTACLRIAFKRAVSDIEKTGLAIDAVLLDGNPLGFDEREIDVIKGDARCASIAAASIVAKVERDALMCRYASTYPEYGFDRNKGYGSEDHIRALRQYGPTPLHRISFCGNFLQDSLF